jgi:hypothetical protein
VGPDGSGILSFEYARKTFTAEYANETIDQQIRKLFCRYPYLYIRKELQGLTGLALM